MSIIHEALKKTQESMKSSEESRSAIIQEAQKHKNNPPEESPVRCDIGSEPIPVQAPLKAKVQSQPKSTDFPWRLAGVGSLVGLFLVAIMGASTFFNFHPDFKKLVAFHRQVTPSKLAITAPQMLTSNGSLLLSGIMMGGQHRLAVINDQTYEIGDRIGDKKITGIAIDHVTLQEGPNTFILKTRI